MVRVSFPKEVSQLLKIINKTSAIDLFLALSADFFPGEGKIFQGEKNILFA